MYYVGWDVRMGGKDVSTSDPSGVSLANVCLKNVGCIRCAWREKMCEEHKVWAYGSATAVAVRDGRACNEAGSIRMCMSISMRMRQRGACGSAVPRGSMCTRPRATRTITCAAVMLGQ